MRYQGKFKGQKPAARLISGQKGKLKLAAALWVTAAFVVLMALGASARNALLQESAVKAASDRFERQLHGYSTPTVSQATTTKSNANAQPKGKQSKVPTLAAPRGIDEGNKFIAQTAGGGDSSGGGAVYDPERRIVKIVETRAGVVTSTKQFVWAGDQLAEERDASGNVTKRFFDLGEQISGTNYYYTRDQIGSVREMTNSSAVVQSQFNFDPYGRPTQIAGTGAVPDFGFAGMYVHQPSGLNLAVNRTYDPFLGRWISRDPIDDPTFRLHPSDPEPDDSGNLVMASAFEHQDGSPILGAIGHDPVLKRQLASLVPAAPNGRMMDPNSYDYVANNPVNRRDPSGLLMSPPPKPQHCPSDGLAGCYRNCIKACSEIYTPGSQDWSDCLTRCFKLCRGEY